MMLASQTIRLALGATLLLSLTGSLVGQNSSTTQPAPQTATPAPADHGANTPVPVNQQSAAPNPQSGTQTPEQKQLSDIVKYLNDQKNTESDFSLVLGIGSLILHPGVTDYQNQSNVLSAASLGAATPQFLTGVSFRTKVPSLFLRFGCGPRQVKRIKDAGGDPAKNPCYGETWQRNPWNAFLSLKFAPGSSNPINGYVLGGSFSLAHYLDFLVGFALTPVNEPSPGFRAVAAQFVTAEQKLGLDMNFNPSAMLHNSSNAFDGFPTTNPATGALIYAGNPLATHYRGGVVIGVSVPIAFSAFLKGGSATPPPTTTTPASAPAGH